MPGDDKFIAEMKSVIYSKTGYDLRDGDPIFPLVCCLMALSGSVTAEVLELVLKQKGSMEGEIARDASERIVRVVERQMKFRFSAVAAVAAFAIGIVVGGMAVALMMR